MNKKEITKAIEELGYSLVQMIEKEAKIDGVFADLYLATVETYLDSDKAEKVRRRFLKKYGIIDKLLSSYMADWPLALIALYVMESGEYFGPAVKGKHFL